MIEFSRIVSVDKFEPQTVHPNKQESLQLCKRLGIKELKKFETVYAIQIKHGEELLYGKIKAIVVQECQGVDVENSIEDSFKVLLTRVPMELSEEEEMTKDVEYIPHGEIDLGEIATQYLILNIDPNPQGAIETLVYEDPKENPFSVLSKLK